jgi:hypothetical protein
MQTTPQIPQPGHYGVIDVQDVRDFIFDRTLEDNQVGLDLAFSDDEITKAMRFAAMRYNETTPYVDTVNAAYLKHGMLFLNGIAYGLYLSKLQQLSRQDITYQAGSMTIDAIKPQLDHLTAFVKIFKDEFERLAKERKLWINTANAFGSY